MAEILAFQKPQLPPEAEGPHLAGLARCMNCRHSWAATAPIGTTRLECPQCTTCQGAWVGAIQPPVDKHVFICNCGNDLFFVRPEGLSCGACGVWAVGH